MEQDPLSICQFTGFQGQFEAGLTSEFSVVMGTCPLTPELALPEFLI